MNKLTKIILFSVLVYLFSSCSLKYGMTEYDENVIPEFVFNEINFDRYEDNKKSLNLSAEKMEQYKDGKSLYAKNLDFKIMDDNNQITTEGKCNLLSANTQEEKYILYENIEIENKKDEMVVTADNLKWNGKTEQLTSGRNDTVSITKGNTFIQGSGFSASGVSKQFSFTGVITGETNTESQTEQSAEEQNITEEK